jgi:SecD/SecF fusion protein
MDGITPTVSMQMNTKGAKIWEEMTGNAFNQSSQIAIVLDDIVYSAPGVPVGQFQVETAKYLDLLH